MADAGEWMEDGVAPAAALAGVGAAIGQVGVHPIHAVPGAGAAPDLAVDGGLAREAGDDAVKAAAQGVRAAEGVVAAAGGGMEPGKLGWGVGVAAAAAGAQGVDIEQRQVEAGEEEEAEGGSGASIGWSGGRRRG